jgi:hypothetical protein
MKALIPIKNPLSSPLQDLTYIALKGENKTETVTEKRG